MRIPGTLAVAVAIAALLAIASAPTAHAATTKKTTTTTKKTTTTTTKAPSQCATRACGSFDPTKACQCNVQCTSYKDCCPDYAALCQPTTTSSTASTTTTTTSTTTASVTPIDPSPTEATTTLPSASTPTTATPPTCTTSQVLLNGACTTYAWTNGPPLPVDITEVSAGIIGSSLFVIGDGQLNLETKKWTYEFNLATNTWFDPQNGLARAQRQFYGDHTAAEVFDNKLFVFAGLCCQTYCPTTACTSFSKVQIFNPAANTWTRGTDIPWYVDGSMSSARIGDLIYVCGGEVVSTGTSLKKCGIYNPTSNTWSTNIPDMPQDLHHAACGTDGAKMYVFGGRKGGNGVSTGQIYTQIYNPATNTWTLGAPLPTPRSGMGHAPFLGGELYVIGGETGDTSAPGATSKGTYVTVEMYNPVSNTWRTGLSMPFGMHAIYPIVHNNRILITGGGPQIDRGTSKTFLIYGPV